MEKQEQTPERQYVVDRFRPEDAAGIAELFKAVYGDGYPIRLYYDPQQLTEANRTGRNYCVVARTTDGRVIGVHNIYRSAPYELLYEWGAGLVLSEYRAVGVTGRIAEYMLGILVPELGIDEVYGEPVCNHTVMQRMTERARFIETGLEVALMPAEAYTTEKSAAGRVATLIQFRCFRPRPHTVFVPNMYEDELRFLYSILDDERTFKIADESLPAGVSSDSTMQIFDFAQVARIAINAAGADFEDHISRMESEALARNVVVFQVWLKLGSPAVGSAVEILRSRGYFLGGILPRWFDEDGILMQKLRCGPDFDAIQLLSDRSKEILKIVKQDWQRSAGLGG